MAVLSQLTVVLSTIVKFLQNTTLCFFLLNKYIHYLHNTNIKIYFIFKECYSSSLLQWILTCCKVHTTYNTWQCENCQVLYVAAVYSDIPSHCSKQQMLCPILAEIWQFLLLIISLLHVSLNLMSFSRLKIVIHVLMAMAFLSCFIMEI